MNTEVEKEITDEILSESKSLYASSACSYSNSKTEDSKEQDEYNEYTNDDLAIWSENEIGYAMSPFCVL